MANFYDAESFKVAILDMYDGHVNEGMRCIREILNQFGEINNIALEYDEFDVRGKVEIPDLSYDVYISTGGPGSPIDSAGTVWENAYFDFLQNVLSYNENASVKKQVFFICHSFQLACRFFDIALVSLRKSTSFGVFPVHMLPGAKNEVVFRGLADPFYAVDSRDYQVVQPNINKINEMGATLLAIEKARPHIPLERAVMALRFNDAMIGTQFHPEADPFGMAMYLQKPERKKIVIENHGEAKWQSMLDHLIDPDKITHTYAHILPNFLANALHVVSKAAVEV